MTNARRSIRRFAALPLLFIVSCRAPAPGGVANTALPAMKAYAGVLDALSTHQIVLLGESHRSSTFHRFLRELVHKPEFASRVTDIVVEFGNARYQPILDRYIAGDSVPRDSLRLIWRNTTQLLAWDSPLYEQFYATVRQVNLGLPRERRLRVLAGDPPIDWTRTRVATDIPPSYGDRDIETLRLIEREVLQRGRKALVVIGAAHAYREGPGSRIQQRPLERAALGDQLNRLHPGAAYIIDAVFGDSHPEIFRLLSTQLKPGELAQISGAPLGKVSSSVLYGNDITLFRMVDGERIPLRLQPADFPDLGHVLDELIYFGKENPRILASPDVYLKDPDYVAELRRRIVILTQFYGIDIWTEELDKQLAKGGSTAPVTPLQPETLRAQVAALRRMAAAVNAGDATSYAAVYAPGALIAIHGGDSVRGRPAIEQYEVALLRDFPGTRFALYDIWQKDGITVARYGVSGRAPTGRPMGHEGLLFYRFSPSGLIDEERRYLDSMTPMAQLDAFGVVPARALPILPTGLKTHLPGRATAEDANVAVVRATIAATDAGNQSAFLSMIADDAEVDELMLTRPFRGKPRIAEWFGMWGGAVRDASTEITRIVGVDDFVLLESIVRGTLRGPFGSLAASDKPFAVHRAAIVQLKSGKIIRLSAFMNGKELAEATGQWPPEKKE